MWKVEHQFSYGWDDAGWHDDDDQPARFETRSEAQDEIDLLVRCMSYDPAEYRIVKA